MRLKLIVVTFLHFKDLTENQDQDITRQLNQMKRMTRLRVSQPRKRVDRRRWRVETHSKCVLAEQYMYLVGYMHESLT